MEGVWTNAPRPDGLVRGEDVSVMLVMVPKHQ